MIGLAMKYVCPMHPKVHSNKPGRCPKCGMRLVTEKNNSEMPDERIREGGSYDRLFIIIGLIALATIAIAVNDFGRGAFTWRSVMANFMAGFFLVFSGFKLIDIKGFAEGYSTYDLLARRALWYGYAYPFLELAFGLAYLTSFHTATVNILVLIVMSFSGIGVMRSMLKKQRIQCACLGTIIKTPLGRVTLVEDFGMAMMALALILVA
ncbi:Uncharacterised protein [uncultured archaeon]|nr:Uncharacterised protein [uncultured archaeon]